MFAGNDSPEKLHLKTTKSQREEKKKERIRRPMKWCYPWGFKVQKHQTSIVPKAKGMNSTIARTTNLQKEPWVEKTDRGIS